MADIEIGMSVIKSMAHEIAQEVLEEISKEKPEIKDRIESYDDGYQQGAREFAEWLPQHFDLRFSNNPDVWLDEFFNHTTDKVLAEWQKGRR